MSRRAEERRERDAELYEPDADSGQVGSGGQSGDTQGLSPESQASDESVEELAEDDQAFEAGILEGVEEAEDHPGRPVHSREDQRPAHESELPPDPDWK